MSAELPTDYSSAEHAPELDGWRTVQDWTPAPPLEDDVLGLVSAELLEDLHHSYGTDPAGGSRPLPPPRAMTD